jgi:hypothetical protein
MKTVHLTWESKLLRAGDWRITGPDNLTIPFYHPRAPWNQPKPLSAVSAKVRFQQLLTKNPRFTEFWARATGGYETGGVRLMFHAGEESWRLPWELLLASFNDRDLERVIITRGTGDSRPIQPSDFDKPLQIQIILGDNSGRRGGRLRLKDEVTDLTRIYDGLEQGVKHNVRLLECVQPTIEELPGLLKSRRPDVLWFSGHGTAKPPVFCLKSNDATIRDLTPALLGRIIKEAGVRPVYVIFLACHLALGIEADQLGAAPDFFEALIASGVQGMLVMQGAINDTAAVHLATALFRHLAVGRPLDWAVASARSVVRDAIPDQDSVEWARPAVWSSGQPPSQLRLAFADSDAAQRQVAARQLLRARVTAPTDVDLVADPVCCERVRKWLNFDPPRLHLVGTPHHAGTQTLWIRLLLALQSSSNKTIIAIELEDEDSTRALRLWAEAIQREAARWYEPFLHSTDLLDRLKDDPKTSWPDLCAIDGIVIAIRDYEQRELEAWFLNPLEQRTSALTLLLRAQPISADWPMENLEMQQLADERVNRLLEQHPSVLNALAVVGMPVRESWLRHAELIDNLQTSISQLLVATQSGSVLNASASAYIAARMGRDDCRKAHFDCMRILDHPDVRLRADYPVRLLRLSHCLAAERGADAVKESQAVLVEIRKLDRPWRAVQVGDLIDHLHREFSPTVSLHLAWARMMIGDVDLAEMWLGKIGKIKEPLEEAWYHGLKAEVAKSKGDKQEALNEIDRAIAIVDAQPLTGRDGYLVQLRRYAYRQDRARIYQYLFYEYGRARAEYEDLQEKLADGSESHLLAAVRRNYSECLRSMATGKEDENWQRAKDIIDEEIGKLSDEPEAPIYAELLYERARIALHEGDRGLADDCLQKCLAAAERSQFGMIRAIARAKQFWQFEPFDLQEWKKIESQLKSYPRHGWAIRSAMNGRLRAAKRVEHTSPATSLELLHRNVADAAANPAFDGRSDRYRIVRSYAGLTVVSGESAYWTSFLTSHLWASGWVAQDPSREPKQLWERIQ